MKKIFLKNKLKFIYTHSENTITSFTIGLNAGAIVEESNEVGLAHVVEHMVFKGTKNRSEAEINNQCDKIFGFHNAMTNYPYVVYYGTCLSEDFEKGLEIYSDILLNPTFKEEHFKEEISVICEELKEWSDDTSQFCEDKVLFNGFTHRRIKDLIIGNEDTIKSFTINDVKGFYDKYYIPNNCTISVVSSLCFEDVYKIIDRYFSQWEEEKYENNEIVYEENTCGTFIEEKNDINSCKIQYIFPIHNLNQGEIALLRIFNSFFGEGTSSILYDEIRTKRGLVYDISSKLKNENGIKLYTITLGTSKENVNTSIEIINNEIEKIKVLDGYFTEEKIKNIIKSLKLKRILGLEKSISLSFNICIFDIMYEDYNVLFNEYDIEDITEDEILKVANKVLKNPTIQIIKSK